MITGLGAVLGLLPSLVRAKRRSACIAIGFGGAALVGGAVWMQDFMRSLLASCQLHGLDPWAYLRDIFCLLRTWPPDRFLELAPAFWKQTLQQQDTQERLAANVFRTVTLADHPSSV
jgi:hypothetical protein